VRRKLKRARKRFRVAAQKTPARFYGVEVDGRDLSGEYVLVEVMNVPLIGPRLALSPTSDPGDGCFEVVLVAEHERSVLADLSKTGTVSSQNARIERGSSIRVTAGEGLLHRDGKLVRHATGERNFEICVAPSAISFLHA
jgi:diacylglycerol kinase family enzyme